MPKSAKAIEGRAPRSGAALEILVFSLGSDPATGRNESYGIDVFKVREVMRAPAIVRTPDTRAPIAGMISLRGALVPVIDLALCAGLPAGSRDSIMILTEYSGRAQGYLVEAVDSILRLDAACVQIPPGSSTRGARELVTAIATLGDGRMIMLPDLEKVLAERTDRHVVEARENSSILQRVGARPALCADDSAGSPRGAAAR